MDRPRNTQIRPSFPEVMSMAEVVECSGRKDDTSVRYYLDKPDFPIPIAVLALGPIWVGTEVREFWRNHPIQTRLNAEQVAEIRELAVEAADDKTVAARFGVSITTVSRIRRGLRQR